MRLRVSLIKATLIAGVWLAAAQIPQLTLHTPRTIVAAFCSPSHVSRSRRR